MAAREVIHFLLPDGWYEVPGERPRAFRRAKAGSGVLQVSLLPPNAAVSGAGDDAALDEALTDVLADGADAMDAGEPVSCTTGPCAYGRLATGLFESIRRGVAVRVWYLGRRGRPNAPLVFATFTTGSRRLAQGEMEDAQAIVESALPRGAGPGP